MSTEVHADTEEYTVRWDADLRAVVLEWKRFVTGESFRDGMVATLDLFEEHAASRFLADGRKITTIDDDDQYWISEEWEPRASDAGLETIAAVYPESAIAEMNVERLQEKVGDGPFEQDFFTQLSAARDWLASQ